MHMAGYKKIAVVTRLEIGCRISKTDGLEIGMADIPIVYTLTVCPACDLLRETWRREGVDYEERRVDQSQDTLDEALDYGDSVPIILYPDGKVEIGFQGKTG
ncbi:MAG: hypothetical protein FI692_02155 [SAR202 cluster bacterium]|jgi:glutaredoxin|nr:hypothetical protein [SAR202 cluster bacterium]